MTWKVVLALLMGLIVSSCGYTTASRTAKGIKSIAVPFFDNQTAEPNLELRVTEAIINNLISDNTLKVVDESAADAVLEGSITEFRNVPFSFNQDLNAEEYLVVITVNATLYNRRLNEPIWENKTIKGDSNYFLDTSAGISFDDAVTEALFEITERILNLTVQEW